MELRQGLGLTIFDIDDTLFHTTAEIKVMKDGQMVRSLNNQQFNNYELQPGESFDFGEFRNAEKFNRESQPIRPMIAKLKAILNNAADSTVIMLTARADFDDKETFLDTFRQYGIDMSRVHVHRAGNLPGDEIPAEKKAIWVRRYLDTGKYSRVRLYDDSRTNLRVFKALEQEYPDVKFEAYYVGPQGQASVHEAEEGTPYADDIKREFKKMGYRQIGSGADAIVWAKERGYVIKILMPDDSRSLAIETFKKFAEFCAKHQGVKCLPVINEYNDINVLDKEYVQIDMERLYPIKKRSFNEGIVWFFSELSAGQESWETVDHAMGLPSTWKEYNKAQASRLADTWQNLSMSDNIDEYKVLYKTMNLLYNTGKINKFGWDLHTENVMQRRNGDLVITDPWYAIKIN